MIETATYTSPKTAWLGSFPEHWKVLRIKNLFREIDARSETGTEELLSVSHYTGVTPRRDSLENEDDNLTNAASLVGYKKVTAGDLVSNIMLAWNGSLGIAPCNGITSPAYCVYRCLPGNNPEYFGYLFSTALFKAEFRRNSTGIIDSRLRLYSDKFFSIFSFVPPKDEQDKIVEYIKFQSEKIDRFVAAKLRFINLLKEQKLRIIDKAVTNSAFKYKPKRLKNIATINDEAITESTNENFILKYIDIGNVNSDGVINELQEFLFKEAPLRARRIVRKGDVIISTVRTYLHAITIIDSDDENLIASTGFAVLRPKNNIIAEFLNYALRASYFIESVSKNSYGVSYPAINSSTLSALKIIVPSSLEEQEKIVKYIKEETINIDATIFKAVKEIEFIREYKQAMIANAVIGNI